MASVRQGLKTVGGRWSFCLAAVLLSALVRTGPASALCGPAGPAAANNTACGTGTLASNTTGANASAFGANALSKNTTGYNNTASGANTLQFNTTGYRNSAFGTAALKSNTTGNYNTASGYDTLYLNTTGSYNTVSGVEALFSNITGSGNTASGVEALFSNTTGGGNTASGFQALPSNTTGFRNTASGFQALLSNTTGFRNTASGFQALPSNTIGSSNIGLGYNAGFNIVAGSNNIEIGGSGTDDESNTIRIGAQGTQTATFIAGISGTTVTGADVVVSSTGQLGVVTSSARYKRDIRDMGGASAGLMRLRPVTFRYKDDPSGTLQYGLVAEEVARVYPELVTRGTDGKFQSVRYLELTALLLNELQKQARETRQFAQRLQMKDAQLAAQQRQIDALKQQNASINALSERLAALEQQARMAHPEPVGSLAVANRDHRSLGARSSRIPAQIN